MSYNDNEPHRQVLRTYQYNSRTHYAPANVAELVVTESPDIGCGSKGRHLVSPVSNCLLGLFAWFQWLSEIKYIRTATCTKVSLFILYAKRRWDAFDIKISVLANKKSVEVVGFWGIWYAPNYL